MLSNNGNEIKDNLLQKMNKLFGSNHSVTSPYKPNTNGLSERFNQ